MLAFAVLAGNLNENKFIKMSCLIARKMPLAHSLFIIFFIISTVAAAIQNAMSAIPHAEWLVYDKSLWN